MSSGPCCPLCTNQPSKNLRESLGSPVRLGIAARIGQLLFLGTIGQHRPKLVTATDGALEDDVPPVWRPGRKIIPPIFVRELDDLLARDIHHVNILSAEY